MKISRGVKVSPQKVVIYGPEGIGKSTLGSQFPSPLFLDVENSTKLLDVARVDPAPASWTELCQTVQEITASRPAEFSTIVLDTADWAEQMCVKQVCDSNHKSGIEDFGYGKGYVYVAEEFGKLLNQLTAANEAGYNIVILAHAKMRKFELPDQMGAYDRWELKLSRNVAPMVKEWADMCLFANYKTLVVTTGKGDNVKGKAQGQGKRVIYTTHHSCWDAKNRHGLPDEIPMDFSAIAPYIPSAHPQPVQPTGRSQRPAPQPVQPTGRSQRPAPQPVQEAPAQAKQPDQPPEDYPYAGATVPPALAQLMARDKVTEAEVREMVGKAGHFPAGTPWETLEKEGYVTGYIIPNWEWFVKEIESTYNLPF